MGSYVETIGDDVFMDDVSLFHPSDIFWWPLRLTEKNHRKHMIPRYFSIYFIYFSISEVIYQRLIAFYSLWVSDLKAKAKTWKSNKSQFS